jgi:hypothetical protein
MGMNRTLVAEIACLSLFLGMSSLPIICCRFGHLRGAPKAEFASQNWNDEWFPNPAPNVETMRPGREAKAPAQRAVFLKRYRAEMATSENSRTVE